MCALWYKLNAGNSVMLFYAEAEGNKMSRRDLTGFYPSITIHNWFSVIKPLVSANICDMIHYFCAVDLKLFS